MRLWPCTPSRTCRVLLPRSLGDKPPLDEAALRYVGRLYNRPWPRTAAVPVMGVQSTTATNSVSGGKLAMASAWPDAHPKRSRRLMRMSERWSAMVGGHVADAFDLLKPRRREE